VLASSVEEVFIKSDVTILSLPGYPEVEAVTDRFLAIGVKNKGVIDISTSYPASSKKIHVKFKAAGGSYLDAPLTGTPTYMKMLYEEYKAPSFILDGGLNMFKPSRIMGLGDKDSSEVAKVTYKNLGIEI
jgi:hypothetical protein